MGWGVCTACEFATDDSHLIGVCFGTLGACDPMLPLFRADTPHACTCGKTGFEYLYPIIFNRETEHELWDLWSLGSGAGGAALVGILYVYFGTLCISIGTLCIGICIGTL